MITTTLLALSLLTISSAFDATKICEGSTGIVWKDDPTDCSTFYLCFNGHRSRYVCPRNMVTDVSTRSCVPKGSRLDKCSKKNSEESLCAITGSQRSLKESCAKFVKCLAPREEGATVVPEVNECPYPLLYEEDSSQCKYPETVKCGDRHEPKDPCEYEANQCKGPNCIPCNVLHASCAGLTDGLNGWKGRERSPYFIICRAERVVYQGQCPAGEKGQIFDSVKRQCVEY